MNRGGGALNKCLPDGFCALSMPEIRFHVRYKWPASIYCIPQALAFHSTVPLLSFWPVWCFPHNDPERPCSLPHLQGWHCSPFHPSKFPNLSKPHRLWFPGINQQTALSRSAGSIGDSSQEESQVAGTDAKSFSLQSSATPTCRAAAPDDTPQLTQEAED